MDTPRELDVSNSDIAVDPKSRSPATSGKRLLPVLVLVNDSTPKIANPKVEYKAASGTRNTSEIVILEDTCFASSCGRATSSS